jgi:hypothetical protein
LPGTRRQSGFRSGFDHGDSRAELKWNGRRLHKT